jgi:putative alpha-1,2-mannosidase
MAKAVADVTGEDQGGFASDNSPITGWSHMHDSGTGGSPSLGNFPIFPYSACPSNDVTKCEFNKNTRAAPRQNGSASAHPGYFAVSLENGIKGEATVTNHTALYRFTFPKKNPTTVAASNPLILLDLTDLPNSRSDGAATVDAKTGRITANGTFEPSFGLGNYRMYVCVDWHGAKVKDVGTWLNEDVTTNHTSVKVSSRGDTAGAWVRFENPTNNVISARVGVSFISNAKACSNALKEIPRFDFNRVSEAAKKAWIEKLSVVTIDAGAVDESIQRVFWSGMYRSMISPQDYTGENPLWESDEPYYDSYYW